MLKSTTTAAALTALVAATLLTACGSEGVQTASVRGGAVPLSQVRLGTREEVFKDAVTTFAHDPNGSFAGKTQYLSRINDTDGGQYVAQVKNDECFEINIVHNDQPVSKEVAVKKMEHLLPPEIVAAGQPVVKSQSKQPVDVYIWDKKFRGQLFFTDNSHKDVKVLSVARIGATL